MKLRPQTILILTIVLNLVSCSENNVTYSYDEVKILRVDNPGRSTFYYLKNDIKQSQINATYSGINDGFKAYLQFDKNGRVYILSGDGFFTDQDNDTILIYKRILAGDRPALTENTYKISFPIEHEKNVNRKTNSKVIAQYE